MAGYPARDSEDPEAMKTRYTVVKGRCLTDPELADVIERECYCLEDLEAELLQNPPMGYLDEAGTIWGAHEVA